MKRLIFLLALLIGPTPALAASGDGVNLGGFVYTLAGEGSVNMSTFALDANTDAYGCVYCMPEAATITKACSLLGFKTGTPPTYIISLQTLDASGYNSGTVMGGGTPASATFTVGSDGTFQCTTLANSIALTRGECFAMNVAYSSGTINASNYEEFGYGLVSNGSTVKNGFPYCYTNTAGTKAKTNTRFPVFAVQSASKTYGMPGIAAVTTAYSSNSTPDEYAIAFNKPSSTCSTYTVRAVTCLVRMSATGKTVDVKLYDGTTALQTISAIDSDLISATPAASDRVPYRFTFTDATLSDLDCGTTYRIGFVPNETSSNFALSVIQVGTASDLSAYPGGTGFYLSTRTDAGAWTDVTTKRPLCDIEIESETDPSGGSETFTGSVINRGLN